MSTRTSRPARAPHPAAPLPAPRTAARTVLRLTTLTATAADPKLPTPLMSLTYSGQMIVGTMVAVAGAHFFAEREAARCD
ncbi:hypothetical protein DDE74_09710 [Streptomyces lydicus]|uniref:Uncharacterized protein n=1 Tax=Streptomyces lydicus TaxID=47763 RepID=A0A3Q9K8T9_9ACTN|nr:hypothetical protein [Streptomyces lydicus]AZS71187.1 hypothetical protein DDE74_09710 [Streptomyces lydicus]